VGRRASGEGSVYKSPDGRWRGSVDLGWTDGKRHRNYVSGKTQQDALRKLRAAQRSAEVGVVADGRLTVGRWLDQWLATVVDGRAGTDNTRAHYRQIVKVHLVPALGRVRLDRLTAGQVDDFLTAKAAEGLSRTYIARMRTTLADALRHAERRGLVARNAAELAVMPRTTSQSADRTVTAADARALLRAARGERLEALLVVGLTTGLRPGELTGLLWEDLDLDAATLRVSGAMKRGPDGKVTRGGVKRSTGGRRTLSLPPMAVTALREHRRRQAAERLAAGSMWVDHGLVFSSEVGTPLDPSNVRRTFRRVAERAGVAVRVPYAMRHAAVSLLVDAGQSIEEVADLLGDDPRTLYRHYRHRVQPVATAALAMEQILG